MGDTPQATVIHVLRFWTASPVSVAHSQRIAGLTDRPRSRCTEIAENTILKGSVKEE